MEPKTLHKPVCFAFAAAVWLRRTWIDPRDWRFDLPPALFLLRAPMMFRNKRLRSSSWDSGVRAIAPSIFRRTTKGYGLTETSGASFRAVTTEERLHSGSVGRLLPNNEAKIVDPDTGIALPPGKQGELWIKGPTIMQGYIGDSKSTSETLMPGGWLRTGDLCYIDHHGHLFVVDRLKELIKYKGYQVAPAELEQLLQSHPEIVDAAVIPYPDEEAGQLPMTFVVRHPQSALDKEQVIDFISKQVAPYKKIRRVAFVSSIPKSPSGKILRKELTRIHLPGSKL